MEPTPVDARALTGARGPARDAAVAALDRALVDTGFGVLDPAFDDATAVEDALAEARRFFDLPDDDPRKRAVDNRDRQGTYGWMPLFGEPAYQPGTIAHVESFDCGLEGEIDADKSLEGANVWPELPGFRRGVVGCWDAFVRLGDAVLDALSDAAGPEAGWFTRRCASRELNTMRLLRYPASDAPDDDVHVGISAHSDFECVSLVLQTAPGLELQDARGAWREAPARDGGVVVLVGDMLERWTNGRYRATRHRVRNTRDERLSVVVFFAVDDDVVVEPLPRHVTVARPARFAPVRQREHIDAEVRRAEANRRSTEGGA